LKKMAYVPLLVLLSLLGVFFLPLSQGCYHPQYYLWNTVVTHVDDVDSNLANNPIITYYDDTAGYSYSVSLNSIWEATSNDGGTTLNPVANSQITDFAMWCIEPKTTDPTEFETGAVYQAEGATTANRFTTFWMSSTVLGANSAEPVPKNNQFRRRLLDASAHKAYGFHVGTRGADDDMPNTSIVRYNITFTGYNWVSQDANAMLVVQFDLTDNNNPSQLMKTGPGTVEFNQAYFAMNKTWAQGGADYSEQVGAQLMTDPVNAPNSVYVVFQHFDTNINLDPDIGTGMGPGPSWSPSWNPSNSITTSDHHGSPTSLSPWIVVLIVAGVAAVIVGVIAFVGLIVVKRRNQFERF